MKTNMDILNRPIPHSIIDERERPDTRCVGTMRQGLIEHLKRVCRIRFLDVGDDGFAATIGKLRVIASWDGGWDHVSVSLSDRCPTWDEMTYVKQLFWDDEDCVVQYHPPKSRYVNNYANCLHLWKSQQVPFPGPPEWMVGMTSRNGTVVLSDWLDDPNPTTSTVWHNVKPNLKEMNA